MVNYANLAAVALKLIEKNGRTITLVRNDTAAATPSEPWKGPADVDASVLSAPAPDISGKVGFPVKAAFVESDSKLGEFFSGTVMRGEKVAIIAGSAVEPEAIEGLDTAIDGDDVWSIMSTDKLRPADVTLLYILRLGR